MSVLTRILNDTFRRDIFNHDLGTLIITAGIAALSDVDRFALVREVQTFEDFTPDNDPWDEHDFGTIKFHGTKYFWKADPHPADDTGETAGGATRRIITIMRADEY